MPERRSGKFRELLSMFMVVVAAIGGGYILLDPRISFVLTGGTTVELGGEGFSADLKGAVASLILIGGFVAVKEYWLGASASGQNQQEVMGRIAEASAAAPAKPLEDPK